MATHYSATGTSQLVSNRAIRLATAICLCALAITLIQPPVWAGHGDGTRPLCEVCRRFADSSPSRMEVIFTIGKRTVTRKLCSVFCYLEMMEDYQDNEPEVTRIINYSTLEDELSLWVNLDRAHFVMTNEGDEEKCNQPFAFAYQTRQQAEAAAEEGSGIVLEWDELAELVLVLTDEYEPEKPGYRYKSNKRRPR